MPDRRRRVGALRLGVRCGVALGAADPGEPMQIQKIFMLLYACLFALLLGLLGTLGGMFSTEADIAQAKVRRNQSQLLADELRQSSDDLTQMARLYAVTGEARFRRYFDEILAIRNGKAPRPERYDLVYWDLVRADGERPRPSCAQPGAA